MLILSYLRALCISRAALALENLALRQQLAVLRRSVPRPRIRMRDRLFFVVLRQLWSGWRDCLVVVQPATVLRWHRSGWRLFWRLRSRGKPGRPVIALELRELIRRLSREKRLWGVPRIHAELTRLGFEVAKSTVEKYRVRGTRPASGNWMNVHENKGL